MRLLLLAVLCHISNSLIYDNQEEAFAVTNLRIITVTKGEIEGGTILVKGEKIVEVGKEVKVPAGTRVIDGKGLTAFPGMVNAVSRIGTDPFASGGSVPIRT